LEFVESIQSEPYRRRVDTCRTTNVGPAALVLTSWLHRFLVSDALRWVSCKTVHYQLQCVLLRFEQYLSFHGLRLCRSDGQWGRKMSRTS